MFLSSYFYSQTKSDLSKIQMNLKSEFTSNTKHLRQQISKLNEELKDLHDFKQKKHNIESELNSTKDALTKEKHERENREAFLGRRFLSERERLKKEMLNKIRETKLHLLEMTENQLHTTTKRTIMENEQMTIELQYQSKETEKLLKSNLQNIDLNMNLQRHIKLHKKVEKMLATRTYFLQKLVEQLHNELKKKENDKQISNQHNTQLQLQLQQIQNTMNAENNGSRNRNKRVHTSDAHKMHDKLKSVQVSDRNGTKIGSSYSQQRVTSKDVQKSEQKGYKRGQIEIKKLKRDLAVAQKTYQSFLNLQSEAVTFIWTCLEDVKCSMKQKIKDSQSAVNERDIKKYDKKLSLDEMSMNDRQWMLEKLLEKLTAQNAHAFIDLGLEQEMDNGKKDSNVNIETRDMLMYRTPSELALMN